MNCMVLFQACIKKSSSSTISRHFSGVSTFSTRKLTKNKREGNKRLEKALRILDLITPTTPTVTETRNNHFRLIQACMHDLLETDPNRCLYQPLHVSNNSLYLNSKDEVVFDDDDDVSWSFVFFRMHKKGMRTDVSTLSCALSSCGASRSLYLGIQLHCLAITTGFHVYVYIGSSLISLYGKCGKLDDAYKVFDEMPLRNVVSWTAIIAGFAQQCQVDVSLELYDQMRHSTFKPNDFTFISLLSACTGSGLFGQGRSAHCQTIQLGFDSYIHISNSLISMYAKCGNIDDALHIFEMMPERDVISWNSMIAGYAQHGLADRAIYLLNEMKNQKIRPDAITFLGILSSCRHSGLVEQARLCFNSMLEHSVKPELDHYSCIVDLLGRAGFLEEAQVFIEKMPICPNAIIWGSLLSSCRLHGNVWIGIQAAESRLSLEPGCAATHVQLANLYASVGCWDQAARVRKLMKDRGLKTNPGCSWIEILNEVYIFRAEDGSNTKANEIFPVLNSLVHHMRSLGYVHKMHEEEVDL